MSERPQWKDPTDPANYPVRPERARHRHIAAAVKFSPSQMRADMKRVEGFNAKLAVIITSGVGTMACAYVFALIALLGLSAALKPGGEGIIAWIAQTFLQLVLLSIIMVGQRVQALTSDARSEHEFADIQVIVDRLDENTAGGIKAVLDKLDLLEKP